eukprot:TRINITY_DN5175_c0_g3_i2.p1 TRINITY_DN5175_c0_g3~~TRINITY_DN5175_c0_g3_i2.p1  ORF type:complete len:345 (-),score=66.60 TRINITY_DN5175_c0_g3_i2:37-1071(-)
MQGLKGIALIERETQGDILMTWNYPHFPSQDTESILISHSQIGTDLSSTQNSFTKFKGEWIYSFFDLFKEGEHRFVHSFVIVILSTEYHPEKYAELTALLGSMYKATRSTVPLLNCYLDVFTDGAHTSDHGSFDIVKYQKGNAHLMATSIKEVVQMFEESTIWIWAAIIMKKRIAVYSESPLEIQKYIRAMPLFVAHRRDWNLLRPFVSLDSQVQIDDIRETGIYIFGTTDINVKRRTDLFDILLDLSQGTVIIPDQSKEDFVETQFHVDLSAAFQIVIENESAQDKHVIKAIRESNKSIVDELKEISSGSVINFETIQSQDWNSPKKGFMYAVASAEGLTTNQ